MAAVMDSRNPAAFRLDWLPVAAGLGALYAVPLYNLATGPWQTDEGAHGAIIFAVVLWLVWRQRETLFSRPAAAPAAGFAALLCGLLLYVLGRSQNIALFEISALLPILAGVLLAMRGWPALRALWFPILFVAFMVPLPSFFVDALTGPLKQSVSEIAEHVLYAVGYPVARNGVVLSVGQYQLLVADACSGLQSMFSLSALGMLYLYLRARASFVHNILMLASILPIAFAANIVRVITLILVTYHLGDEAGQSFLHGGAGIVLLMVALAILIALDAGLARVLKPARSP